MWYKFYMTSARGVNAQTILICDTGLLHSHLLYIRVINHHGHFSCFMQLYNTMTAQVPASLQLNDPEWPSRSFKLESNCTVQCCLASHQVWNKTGHKTHIMMLNVYFIHPCQQISPGLGYPQSSCRWLILQQGSKPIAIMMMLLLADQVNLFTYSCMEVIRIASN